MTESDDVELRLMNKTRLHCNQKRTLQNEEV